MRKTQRNWWEFFSVRDGRELVGLVGDGRELLVGW